MKLEDYQGWESQFQRLDGAVGNILRMLDEEPEAVKRILLAAS